MEREILLPAPPNLVRELRVGDLLYLTGRIFTARDAAHRLLLDLSAKGEKIPFDPAQMALFHCGPLVKKKAGGWRVIAAGPTTSMRMEPFEAHFISLFETKIIIGKGGMGQATQAALKREGAVYTHYTGGAGALAAEAIDRVTGVFWLEELGVPEAVWIFSVNRFGPLLVTMDSTGGNLYSELSVRIADRRRAIEAQIEKEIERFNDLVIE
jgi:fumarate hydratase subunit beta